MYSGKGVVWFICFRLDFVKCFLWQFVLYVAPVLVMGHSKNIIKPMKIQHFCTGDDNRGAQGDIWCSREDCGGSCCNCSPPPHPPHPQQRNILQNQWFFDDFDVIAAAPSAYLGVDGAHPGGDWSQYKTSKGPFAANVDFSLVLQAFSKGVLWVEKCRW